MTKPETYRQRALAFVDRQSDLEYSARRLATADPANDYQLRERRRNLVDAALSLAAAAKNMRRTRP